MRGARNENLIRNRLQGIIPADAGSTNNGNWITQNGLDHPRGCGEHQPFTMRDGMSLGSSPRMRGALHILSIFTPMRRIIPADAGSTLLDFSRYPHNEDHPRGCGEHPDYAEYAINNKGSSPRMRGAPFGASVLELGERIIPADAGSTHQCRVCVGWHGDHPRGCGEHGLGLAEIYFSMGSSPRMRGAPWLLVQLVRLSRIIPADAGSTHESTYRYQASQDHPRGCGEHSPPGPGFDPASGSSPRMRGAPFVPRHVDDIAGIIPADAGSTVGLDLKLPDAQDHPRGCGEHQHVYGFDAVHQGSSPRMRGAPRCIRGQQSGRRIIPADAGSTLPCGMAKSNVAGSSPRMRGARKGRAEMSGPFGIIPADAGSTTPRSAQAPPLWDHPRGCGEHCSDPPSSPDARGSSPRMRGAHLKILAIPTI